jgi:CRISPR-associated protein Cas4
METYLPISYLNDFVFCPYSIYLHQIFDAGEDDTYSASPQQKGRTAHITIDKPVKKLKGIRGIYVISDKLRLYGKIDIYYPDKKRLVEFKRKISTIYRGYYYQIWAQYFCMEEMGYQVKELAFYTKRNNLRIPVPLPQKAEFNELFNHVRKIAQFSPEDYQIEINPNKCKHCIYSALCDKTQIDHVYT